MGNEEAKCMFGIQLHACLMNGFGMGWESAIASQREERTTHTNPFPVQYSSALSR